MQYPLPDAFLNRMKEILNDPESFDAFLASYDRHPERGLRLNLKKILSLETSSQENVITYDQIIREFGLHPIPDASSVEYQGKIYYREFYMDEAFLEEKNLRPGHHPYHDAGLYYIQSPEAMQVVNHLNIRPFDRVIDLCASPGGKSTQAADCLSQKAGGFIISNEYVALRARTLSSNFERMGIRNGVVINEDTSRIAAQFPEFFTRVIVDAPCSGEGMFRKDPKSIEEWSPENVETCAARQKEIVENAVHMLAPGGLMSYSTCTYETCENEDIVRYILEHFPDMTLLYEKRHWPHKDRGEGHFVAILKKAGEEPLSVPEQSGIYDDYHTLDEFHAHSFSFRIKEQHYLVPDIMPELKRLKLFRNGLLYESDLGKRIEPEHALSHALDPYRQSLYPVLNLSAKDPRAEAYLHGLQICSDEQLSGKGWCLVACDGAVLGFGKLVNGQIKNHYPKGLRWTS